MKKAFVMTAIMAGTFVGSGFGAVSGGYCHSAEYYRQQRARPVASTVMSERERIAAMELEAARLRLETAKITSGKTSSRGLITLDTLPGWEKFNPEHIDFLRGKVESTRTPKDRTFCQYALGVVYKYGYGGASKDLEEAHTWLTRAAVAGDPDAEKELVSVKKNLAKRPK